MDDQVEVVRIPRQDYEELFNLLKWVDGQPNFFEAGDTFGERVTKAVNDRIGAWGGYEDDTHHFSYVDACGEMGEDDEITIILASSSGGEDRIISLQPE